MTLQAKGIEIQIDRNKLKEAPPLTEETEDEFFYQAEPGQRVELLLDGQPLLPFRDYEKPNVIHWRWQKGPFGRVGFVECELLVDGSSIAKDFLRVNPRKLTLEEYRSILDEISKIAYSLAYDLRETTFEHLDLIEPERLPKTGLEWLETIRGFLNELVVVLHAINRYPHVRINTKEANQYSWEIRRPGPSFLSRIVQCDSHNFIPDQSAMFPEISLPLAGRVPLLLPEEIHEVQTNSYENQLIAQFLEDLLQRLLVIQAQSIRNYEITLVRGLVRQVESLLSLPFLDGVEPLRQAPRPTLVLLRNFRYRQFYEIYRRFHWGLRVHYGDGELLNLYRLTTQHVHDTYQVWAFFKVIEAARLVSKGQAVGAEELINVLHFDELLVRVRDGSRVNLRTEGGRIITISYQPSFSTASKAGPYSVSLPKRPDVTVQIEGMESALVFDAKYRLDSESPEERMAGAGEPKGDDIDKMHVYRDALRNSLGQPFVPAAYVLYPGNRLVMHDKNRLGAIPLRPAASSEHLASIIREGLMAYE